MHQDLSFLEPGSPWPAPCDRARLWAYARNRRLFLGESHAPDSGVTREPMDSAAEGHGFFRGIFNALGRKGSAQFDQRPTQPGCTLNYFRLMTLKLGDLIGAPAVSPGLNRGEKTAPKEREDAVWDIAKNSGLSGLALRAVYDMSRYGDAILRVARSEKWPEPAAAQQEYPANAVGEISLVRPELWFPVVDENDIRRFTAHVLAWVTRENGKRPDGREACLHAEIHTKGAVELRAYALKNGRIKELLSTTGPMPTGLNDFAVIPAQNVLTSDSVFGQDDYSPVIGVVHEIEKRFAQVAKVLDVHSEPTMQGPAWAMTREPDGKPRLVPGGYIVNQLDGDEQGAKVSYLTWDAHMGANFDFIDKLQSHLYALSEMGGTLLGDFESRAGSIPSGSALRRLLFAPLNKAARVREALSVALKKAVALCGTYYGVDLSGSWVTIRWPDALPADAAELTEIVQKRAGNKPTLSVRSAIKALDGVDDEEAEAEIARIGG